MVSQAKGIMYIPVWVDDGVIKTLVLDTGALPVTETNPLTLLQAQAYGYVGTAWQKQPMMFGYSDILRIREVEPNAVVGTNTLDSDAVPAGEIWIVTMLRGYDATSAISSSNIGVLTSGTTYSVDDKIAPGAGVTANYDGFVVLQEGDLIRWRGWGCTLNDDLYLVALGYKMDIDL